MGLISYGLWGFRAVKMKVESQSGTPILSQEFTTFMAMVLLLPFTLLVLFWTSFPLITTIMAGIPGLSKIAPTPAAIDQGYYNVAGVIFSVIFTVILGLNALLGWRETDKTTLKKKLILPVVISIVAAALFVILGYSRIKQSWLPDGSGVVIVMAVLYFLFFGTAVFSIVTNFNLMIRRWKGNFLTAGGYLTHFGFSIMLIGIILSSGFGQTVKTSIPMGESRQALGYDIKFTGTEALKQKEEMAHFDLLKDGNTFRATSISKEMKRGNQMQYVRTPFIEKFLFYDLYLSLENLTEPNQHSALPLEMKIGEQVPVMGATLQFDGYDSDKNARALSQHQGNSYELAKGESVTINKARVTFKEFDMSQHEGGMASGIGAKIDVVYKGKTSTIIPQYAPSMSSPQLMDFPSGGYVAVTKIKADEGKITLSYSPDKKAPEMEVGAVVNVMTQFDTTMVMPLYNPAEPNSQKSKAMLPDGSTLFLTEIDAGNNTARFILSPPQMAQVASIAISTKPMINLVWFGFILLVIGAIVAVFRRMREGKRNVA